jgi:hypothetical protein
MIGRFGRFVENAVTLVDRRIRSTWAASILRAVLRGLVKRPTKHEMPRWALAEETCGLSLANGPRAPRTNPWAGTALFFKTNPMRDKWLAKDLPAAFPDPGALEGGRPFFSKQTQCGVNGLERICWPSSLTLVHWTAGAAFFSKQTQCGFWRSRRACGRSELSEPGGFCEFFLERCHSIHRIPRRTAIQRYWA